MSAKTYHITLNGKVYEVEIEEVKKGERPQPTIQDKAPQPKKEVQVAGSGEAIDAPMPGTIVNIMVSNGDKVKKGQVIAILEAMKMENEIMASSDGTVKSVDVSKGASVSAGDALITIG